MIRLGAVGTVRLAATGVLSCVLLAQGRSTQPSPADPPPNIVLIVADDLGWNSVGYREGWVQTPSIDRLARQGVSLERFYVSPMCSPTRAGLMTGRYPMRLGMARSVVRPWMKHGLPPDEHTIPELLAEAGYRQRGLFGKWHLGHLAPRWHPLAQGFTDFEGMYNGAADYWTRDRHGEIDWHVNHSPQAKKGYTTDLIADAAVRFIRERAADGPFFCYVPFSAPHDPFQAPDKYLARYAQLDDKPGDGKPSDLQTLAAMITCMDDGIGRILRALDETGSTSDTLIWFMSDNGGLKRFDEANRPLREGKLTVYEGGVCVPSAVLWPGVIEGGRKVTARLINLDILPTLLRVARVKPADDRPLDGVDVLDVLTGRAETPSQRDLYFFNGMSGIEKEQIAVTAADGWKLVVSGPDIRRPEGFQTPRHRVELFDLSSDPGETTDLSARYAGRVVDLGRKLVVFRNSEPAAFIEPHNEPPADFRPPRQWRNSPAAATDHSVQVDAEFPGGNVIVDRIDGDRVYLRPDLRDTPRWWFYWYFRVRGAAGRRITFEFTDGNPIGVRGPAMSTDGGNTWSWLGTESVKEASFTYAFPTGADDTRFSYTIPYLEENLRTFLQPLRDHPRLKIASFGRTGKGRDIEALHFGKVGGKPDFRVLLTARHHACETIASFVLEGLILSVLRDDDQQWLRDHVEFLAVPFVDKDGVEQGDQGKLRAPHDPNRDYQGTSIYPAVAALRDRVSNWSEGRLRIALDLHCPYIRGSRNEAVFFVGLPYERSWSELQRFSSILESLPAMGLPFHAKDNLPYGQEWNNAAKLGEGRSMADWAAGITGVRVASTMEIPYANASGTVVTPGTARALGRDLCRAIRQYLQADK